jgi:Leucine-rich repeat (LRR) protein
MRCLLVFLILSANLQSLGSSFVSKLSSSFLFGYDQEHINPDYHSQSQIQLTDTTGYPNLVPTEFNALSDFYYSLHGQDWRYSEGEVQWNFTQSDPNPCSQRWAGTHCLCNTTACHLGLLFLPVKALRGQLPPSIGNFSELRLLNLGVNKLAGTLPAELGNLHSVLNMSLRSNEFIGTIPETLSELTSLIVLDLQSNFLNGTIPQSFSNLIGLEIIDFNRNFLHGPLPQDIGSLKSLTSLRLASNDLSGPLPPSFYELTALKTIYLSDNNFTSTISSSISNLYNLEAINFAVNAFTGTIPPSIGSLKKISALALGFTGIHGPIPTTMDSGMKALQALDLAGNLLSKAIPWQLSTIPKLNLLFLESNDLTGTFPANFTLLANNLVELILDRNFIQGSLPPEFFYFPTGESCILTENLFDGSLPVFYETEHFRMLTLDQNYFTGSIPDSFYMQTRNLSYLDLSYNSLSSSLSQSFNNLTYLTFIYAHTNLFDGSLQFSLKTLKTVREIFLYANRFTGNLYTFVGESMTGSTSANIDISPIPQVQDILDVDVSNSSFGIQLIDISQNSFTGTIPSYLFTNYSLLEEFVATTNCFSGSLPPEICEGKNLVVLEMDGLSSAAACHTKIFPNIPYLDSFYLENPLEGTIPSCLFTQLPNLTALHLSGNGLTGSLPSDIEISPSMTLFSASHNSLGGAMPSNFQQRNWSTFDLSYNKINGQFEPFALTLTNSGTVYLEQNRISGNIPHSLLNVLNIQILKGNMMECNSQKSDLPVHDPNNAIYDCGSDSINNSFFTYGAFFGFIILIILMIEVWKKYQLPEKLLQEVNETMNASVQARNQSRAGGGGEKWGSFSSILSSLSLRNSKHEPTQSSDSIGNNNNHDETNQRITEMLQEVVNQPSEINRPGSDPIKTSTITKDDDGSNSLNNSTSLKRPSKPKKMRTTSASWAITGSIPDFTKYSLLSRFFISYLDVKKTCYDILYSPLPLYEDENIRSIISLMKNLRKTLRFTTVIIMFLFLPIFLGLALHHSTYLFRYIWVFSGIFLTGTVATALLFFCFAFFYIWVASAFYRHLIDLRLLDEILLVDIQKDLKEQQDIMNMVDNNKTHHITDTVIDEEKGGGALERKSTKSTKFVKKSSEKEQKTGNIWMNMIRSYLSFTWNYLKYFLVLSTRTRGLILIFLINFAVMIIIDLGESSFFLFPSYPDI